MIRHTIDNSILDDKKWSENVDNISNYHVNYGEKLCFGKNVFKVPNTKKGQNFFSFIFIKDQ